MTLVTVITNAIRIIPAILIKDKRLWKGLFWAYSWVALLTIGATKTGATGIEAMNTGADIIEATTIKSGPGHSIFIFGS